MRTTIRSFAAVGFGAAAFIIAVSLGTALTAGTGIPLLGGLFNGILVSMVLTIGLLAINRFWTATTMWFVFSFSAVLTTTLGPPGPYKIIIGVIAGIIWDSIYFGLKKRTSGLFLGAIIGAISIMLMLILALHLGFGKNAEEVLRKYTNAFYALILINVIVTTIGVFLGRQVYINRLSKLQIFKNLRAEGTNGSDAKR